MFNILENIITTNSNANNDSKNYNNIQKRLYEEEQKNLYNAIGLPLIDKIMKHSYIPDQLNMLMHLINSNIPKGDASQFFGTPNPYPSGFKNIPLGKGFGLDIQQGGYMDNFPVDYGIKLKKRF